MALGIQSLPDASPSVGRIERRSLPDEIADRIVEEIARGHLLPGERIQEGVIAERLDVSRVPVREALQALAKQGIVVPQPRRGMRVRDIGVDLLRQVFEARLDIELRALPRAMSVLQEDNPQRQELMRCLANLETAADKPDRRAFEAADLAFHRAICMASGNHIAMTLWDALAHHIRILLGLMSDEWQRIDQSQLQHRELIALIDGDDLDALHAYLKTHYEIDEDTVHYDKATNRFVVTEPRGD